MLEEASREVEGAPLDSDEASLVRVARREYDATAKQSPAGSEVERPNGSKDCVTERSCEEVKGEGERALIIFIRINLIHAA